MTTPSSAGNRLFACSAASIGIHLGVGAAILLGLGIAHVNAPATPPAEMVVELAALPSAPPVPPSLSPPKPEQKKAQPKPVVENTKLPHFIKILLDVRPAVVVPPQDRTVEHVDQNKKPADETSKAAAPDAPRKDEAREPLSGAPSASPSNAEQNWEARVLAALERKKRYPEEAQRRGQEDSVYVRIVIDGSGRVISSQIGKSGGFELLNTEVMSLVRRASPFPTPPSDVMKGHTSATLVVPVEFFLKNHLQTTRAQ